jgi:transcriptional regulator with XRE-family HTH domain
MKTLHLGQEVRRLRLESGLTLRGLAAKLGVSAAHLSDIEHDRRRPSETLLRSIADELSPIGATFESFEELVTGIDPEMRDWLASTPGVRKLLRRIKDSGKQPTDILRALEKVVGHRNARKNRAVR